MSPDLPEVGPWARDKLGRLQKYLSAYTRILSRQKWCSGYVYVDAFAGAGEAVLRSPGSPEAGALALGNDYLRDTGVREVLKGSPRVALEIEPPFTRYVFVDRDPERAARLVSLVRLHPNRHASVRQTDCNSYLRSLISSRNIDWRSWRAVVFLDPFGMQVPWETISGLATTKGIEIFLNFPVGMAIQRVLKKSGEFTQRERKTLDYYLGDPGWYDLVYPPVRDLFGSLRQKRPDAAEALVSWYCARLKTAFGYVSRPYLMRNTHGGHLYYLIFTGPNSTGARIANNVLAGGEKK